MRIGPLIIYGEYMTVKEAVENVVKIYMADESARFQEASNMALQHNTEVSKDHPYYSLRELYVALKMGEFDD